MIRTIKVDLNAAFPNMPLAPFQVFKDSAAAITILNVPRMIASVKVSVKNVSNVSQVFTASRQGSSWMAIIPGSFLSQSGTSTRGVKIIGYDSMVPTPNEFTMGAADLFVILSDGTVTPTQEGGDVRHIDFADLTADTVTLGELLRRLKGTATAFLLALIPFVAQSTVFTAPLKDLPGSSPVVTNVTQEAETDPVFTEWTSTNTYVKAESDPTVPAWAKATNPPAETDPTVPSWAKAENPPAETDPTVPSWAKAENPPAETDPTVPAWAKEANPPADKIQTIKLNEKALTNDNGVVDIPVGFTIPATINAWASTTKYYRGQVVSRNNKYWYSLFANNLNNQPTANSKWWLDVTWYINANNAVKKGEDITISKTSDYTMPKVRVEQTLTTQYRKSELSSAGLTHIVQPGGSGSFASYRSLSFVALKDDAEHAGEIVLDVTDASENQYTADWFFPMPTSLMGTFTFASREWVTENMPTPVTDAHIGEIATNVVRAANGGLWDADLGVWWTPVMSNGKLTYQATTNVNLNAGN